MPRWYRVRLPRGVAKKWTEIHSRPLSGVWRDPAEPEVTFRVSDLHDGKVPATSTVAEPEPADDGIVGLDGDHRDEVLATIAAAERSIQPDRLPLVVALVCVLLLLILSSGVLQGVFTDAREHLIEERIKRPRAQMNWRDRHGATRDNLGLSPSSKKPARRAPDLFGF